MSEEQKLFFKSRTGWRSWLKRNHLSTQRIWLVYYKKKSGKVSISYNDAVEEALCFGWIDGQIRSVDQQRFMQRFTPRRHGSKWSQTNIKRIKKLIKEGIMTEYGLKVFKEGTKESDPVPSSKNFTVPLAFIKEIGKNKKALQNFELLSPSSKMMYVYWIKSAKREETRLRRMDRMMKFLETGPHPLTEMPAKSLSGTKRLKTKKEKNR